MILESSNFYLGPHSIPLAHTRHHLLSYDYFLPFRSAADKLQLTHEQVRIIKHDVKSGEIIKIVAFAGTVTCTHTEYLCTSIRLTDAIDI